MIPLSKPIIGEEEKKAVNEVLNSGMLAQGPKVKELEEKFAVFCGSKYAIVVNSGTAAIHTALYAIGIKDGDEVITVPFTFVATANPILMLGGKVIFVDIDEKTFNIDPKKIEEKISPKTKAIITVDLYGQPADYDEIKKIAEKYSLKIIGDACQAHGAEFNGIKTGKLGDLGCFSLYATKNIMSGEGGIITTDNEEFAELCRRFRHHGQSEKTRYEYFDIGYNYRLTDIQAAIALAQLNKLDEFTEKRRKNAARLIEGLKEIQGIEIPFQDARCKHVFHQFTIKCDNNKINRDALVNFLKEKGIGCGIYYPKPLHLHPHFRRFGYKENDFPVSEKISKSVLSLPVHPSLSEKEVEEIINAIKEFSKK